jgi:hypothetical protein
MVHATAQIGMTDGSMGVRFVQKTHKGVAVHVIMEAHPAKTRDVPMIPYTDGIRSQLMR